MANTIRDLMTSNPTTIEPDKTVVDAAKLMRDEDAGLIRRGGAEADRDDHRS
jgi:CBS domain-containing protein